MSNLDRIIIVALAVLLVLSAILVAITIGGNTALVNWLAGLEYSIFDGVLLVLILILFAAYLVMMVSSSFRFDRRSLVSKNSFGNICISAQTITGLVSKTVKDVEGIKDVNVKLYEVEPLKIGIVLQLFPDHRIPSLAESIQSKISDYLRQTVGIEAEIINIEVKGVLAEQKMRVQ